MTDFPAIQEVLKAIENDEASFLKVTTEQLRAAWVEYNAIEAISKAERVNESNANRWMADAEDWKAKWEAGLTRQGSCRFCGERPGDFHADVCPGR